MPRAVSNILLAVAATVAAILVAEILARTFGLPEFGRVIPIGDVPIRTVDGVTLWAERNPREEAADIERVSRDPEAFKIVGVGDSIMYGVGQAKEDTYLERMRRALAARSKRKVEVLNLAVPGYNTMQEAAVLKELDGQIKPNLVLVHHWADDAHQYRIVGGHVVDFADISADGHLVVRALPLPPSLSDFLLLHSRLYDLLTHAVVARQLAELPKDEWTRVSKPLAAIQEQVQRDGGRLVVLASPELFESAAKPTGDFGLLKEFAASRGIEVIDLSEWLRGVDTARIRLDGCHFNAEGHRLIGERLAQYLLEHDLEQ